MFPHDIARWTVSVESALDQTIAWNNVTDPAATSVMVDTGGLTAGFYDITFSINTYILLDSTAIVFEWRNAANSASLWNLIYNTPGVKCDVFKLSNLKVLLGQRFRWYCYAHVDGVYGVGIIATKRAV